MEKKRIFLSAHPGFRSSNLVTAPGGTLYIVDMYRGKEQLPSRGVAGVFESVFDTVAYMIRIFHE